MFKCMFLVLAVAASIHAAHVPSETVLDFSETFQRRITAPQGELHMTVENLKRALKVPGLSEEAKVCLKEQLDKMAALAQQVVDELTKCAGDKAPEVEAVLEKLQAALEQAGAVGVEIGEKFQKCLELLPNLEAFGQCAKEVYDFAAGPAEELANALMEAAEALSQLGAEVLECAGPVLDHAHTEAQQIAHDIVQCFSL